MIQLSNVTKYYAGALGPIGGSRVRALDEVSFEVPAGSSLGVVGPNGAGKSTLIRLLFGYLRPSGGEVSIEGLSPRAFAEREGIGYVPERVDIPPRWTTRSALQAFAALAGTEVPSGRIDEVMREMGIDGLADRRVSTLSKGNLGRLAIAQALLAPRRVMILDEPTDGLDPEWVARLREILAAWRAADPQRVLVIASHNLNEVERIADRVAVLDDGRLREMMELRTPAPDLQSYRLQIELTAAAAARVRALFPGAEESLPGVFRVSAPDLPELNRRIAHFLADGGLVRTLAPEHASLEERFRRSVGQKTKAESR